MFIFHRHPDDHSLLSFIRFLKPQELYAISGSIAAGIAVSVASSQINKAIGPKSPKSSGSQNISDEQSAIATDQYNFYKENFQPLEKSLIGEVATAGDAADQERAAGVAHGDITNAFDAARRGGKMRAMTYGLNPASGRFASDELGLSTGEAATDAQAQNQARIDARELGFQKRFNVAQVGRNIPSQSIAGLGAANRSNNDAFIQQAFLAKQGREGLSPILGPVTKGIESAVTSWFNTKPAGLQPVDTSNETFTQSTPTITNTEGGTTEYWG